MLTALAGESALRRIVRALVPAVEQVVVVVDATLADRVTDDLSGQTVNVVVLDGTPSRAACLATAADRLGGDTTHVLLADHRHPLIPPALLTRVIDALATGAELVVPVLPVTDTVKVVDAQGRIVSTLDRSQLRSVQYPHGMLARRLSEDGMAGVVTVPGDADAVAVALPADAALVEAVIAGR